MAAEPTTTRLRPDPSSADHITVDLLTGAAPSLVFLHGMTSTRLGHKSEALLERARERGLGFARLDFRGHGDSDGELEHLLFSHLVEDVRAVIATIGRCVLFGSSMGGLAAAWTAARHPENIAALVLMSPALGFLDEMAHRPSRSPYVLRRSDEELVTLTAAVRADAAQFEESKLAERIHVPILMVHGTGDQTVPVERTMALCEAIPHANKELWIVSGGSHSLFEVMDEIFDRAELFLEQAEVI